MDEAILRRCIMVAQHMLETRCTIRQAAARFNVSKSSVHKDLCVRLPQIDVRLAREVALLLEYNKAVRHLRGGEATRRRFLGMLTKDPRALGKPLAASAEAELPLRACNPPQKRL